MKILLGAELRTRKMKKWKPQRLVDKIMHHFAAVRIETKLKVVLPPDPPDLIMKRKWKGCGGK